MESHQSKTGAGDEARTRDINLGKVALYQLSYTRDRKVAIFDRWTGNVNG
jgi:hypothetical protein